MVPFERDGKRFVLIANSSRGVMHVSAADIDRSELLATPCSGHADHKDPCVPLALPGVIRLDLLNPEVIVMLMRDMDDEYGARALVPDQVSPKEEPCD